METVLTLIGNIITVLIMIVVVLGATALTGGAIYLFTKIFISVMELPQEDREDLIIATILKDKLMK